MIALIAAYTKNRVIGRDGHIPWHIDGEQKRFRKLTTGNVVIMGRRTYCDIGRPLPGRFTIIISSAAEIYDDNCTTVRSLNDAFMYAARNFPKKDIFIAGGAQVYAETIPLCDKLFITEIDTEIPGDRFFPEFDTSLFTRNEEARFPSSETGSALSYTYVTFTRK